MKTIAANKVTTKNTVPPSTAPSRVEVREQKYDEAEQLTDADRAELVSSLHNAEPVALAELARTVDASAHDTASALAVVRRMVDSGTGIGVGGEVDSRWALRNRLIAHDYLTCAENNLEQLASVVRVSVPSSPPAPKEEPAPQPLQTQAAKVRIEAMERIEALFRDVDERLDRCGRSVEVAADGELKNYEFNSMRANLLSARGYLREARQEISHLPVAS